MKPRLPRNAALSALLCLVLAVAGLETAATSVAATSSSHPYSDPVWFPVHAQTVVGCVGSGTGTNNGPRHKNPCAGDHRGYYAMNFRVTADGPQSPEVYAAGGGRVTRTVSNLSCGGKNSGGNYVAIDHGGGVVSIYQHLGRVDVKAGQYVSAGDGIGTISNSGAARCGVHYLDFIVRTNGGGYQDLTKTVTSLKACRNGQPQQWPSALNSRYTSWVKVPYTAGYKLPSSDGGCGQGSTPHTPSRPSVRARAGKGAVTLSWGSPSGAVMVQQEIFRPSLRDWDAPCTPYSTRGCRVGYAQVASGHSSVTQKSLINGRAYRFRISQHNASGWSAWSAWKSATPKLPPTRPGFRQLYTTGHRLVLLWSMPTSNLRGSTLHGFRVAISHKKGKHYTAWTYHRVGNVKHYAWNNRHAGTRYRVKVQAISNVGRSRWMHTRFHTMPH